MASGDAITIRRPATGPSPRALSGLLVLIVLLAVLGQMVLSGGGGPTTAARVDPVAAADLPISFEPNRGQSQGAVRFLAAGPGYGFFLTDRRAVLSLDSGRTALSMGFVGAATPRIEGVGRLAGVANYIGAGRSGPEVGLPRFAGVRYRGLWPGIGVRFYGNPSRLEYDYDLAPGARAGEIGMRFGARGGATLAADGDLLLRLGTTTVRQPRPRAYQQIGGSRHAVAAHYVLRAHGDVGVALGAYDHGRPLTIDPRILYSTYLGRGSRDPATALAVDGQGDVYLTGSTGSSDFPTHKALQGKLSPKSGDASFVTKLSPDGQIIWSTYLGAGGGSFAEAIAVDKSGAVYVAGMSYPHGMPSTPGAFQRQDAGISESGFVAKLAPSGRKLLYSTYLGGDVEGGGEISGIAVDGSGHAYVTGDTEAEDFPVTPGAAQGPADIASFGEPTAFVSKLNPTGSRLIYSTFLGGSGWDTPGGIAIDKAGDAYVAGDTESQDFPVTPGAYQTTDTDDPEFNSAFVTKLDPSGTHFLYSTYLGGTLSDEAKAITLDSSGDAYVTGDADANFPTTPGAFQQKKKGFQSAFLSVLSPDGTRLLHSTVFGRETEGRGIALGPSGHVFIVGFRSVPAKKEVNQGFRGFLAELDGSGHRLLSWTKLGGGRARVAGVVVDRQGDIYAAGGSGPGLKTVHPLPQPSLSRQAEYPSAYVTKLAP